jgi:hypothetical protein
MSLGLHEPTPGSLGPTTPASIMSLGLHEPTPVAIGTYHSKQSDVESAAKPQNSPFAANCSTDAHHKMNSPYFSLNRRV